jgi:hypothetical protein
MRIEDTSIKYYSKYCILNYSLATFKGKLSSNGKRDVGFKCMLTTKLVGKTNATTATRCLLKNSLYNL